MATSKINIGAYQDLDIGAFQGGFPFANFKINIGDVWKTGTAVKINIGDTWKTVIGIKINIGDVWKTVL